MQAHEVSAATLSKAHLCRTALSLPCSAVHTRATRISEAGQNRTALACRRRQDGTQATNLLVLLSELHIRRLLLVAHFLPALASLHKLLSNATTRADNDPEGNKVWRLHHKQTTSDTHTHKPQRRWEGEITPTSVVAALPVYPSSLS
jgi:hypothetical protein